MTQDEQGYNGWTNYETWSVGLVVDNDERTYNLRRDLVEQWRDEAVEQGRTYDWETPEDHTRDEVAQNIQNWIEGEAREAIEMTDTAPLSYLWSQLLSAALSEVNWRELAENWMSELQDA